VRMSDYGYWVVTYSCAPGLSMSVMVCNNTLSRAEVLESAQTTLTRQTGQKVSPM